MGVDLELTPKTKRPAGERCCEPVVYPDVTAADAATVLVPHETHGRTDETLLASPVPTSPGRR